MTTFLLPLTLVLVFFISQSSCDPREWNNDLDSDGDEFEYEVEKLDQKTYQDMEFELEHNIGKDGTIGIYSSRGKMSISISKTSKTVTFNSAYELTNDELQAIQNMNQKNILYTVRIKANPKSATSTFVMSSLPSCYVIESKFREDFYFHLTETGTLTAFEYRTPASYSESCSKIKDSLSTPLSFISKGSVIGIHASPIITQETSVKIPIPSGIKEETTNKKEPEEENQSFLRKYWYIILPIVLLNLLGGEAPQQQGQRGSGGNAGGGGGRRQ